MQPIDLARELDSQREPLRRLAAALLGDTHGAEDVVQDAFAAALAREERPKGLATWLRAVVRRLALDRRRRASRREARERGAASLESFDATDSLERLELIEALAREVRGLDEPFRTTVRLRYFDGLSPREVALHQRVPLATVESRLARALARLRERLDRRGGRERWLAATEAWIRSPQAPWLEILLMKTVMKSALAAALLFCAWWGWTRLAGSASASRESEIADATLAAASAESVATPASGGERRVSEFPAPAAVPSPPLPPAQLSGIVVDEVGNPLADVELGALCDGEKEMRATPRAKSGKGGRFTIDEPRGGGSLRAVGDAWFTLGASPFGPRAIPCERVVCVVPREPLEGVVVDRDGAPLENVRVEIALFGSMLRLPMPTPDLLSCSRAAVSGRDGRYRIEDAPVASCVQVSARRAGSFYEYHGQLDLLRARQGRILFDYGEDAALVIHGEVVDEHDRPIAGAWIDVGPRDHQRLFPMGEFTQLRSDARGDFDFPIEANLRDVVVIVAAAGRQTAKIEPTGDPTLASSWPSPFTIRLDRPALSVRGRVVDEKGQPLPHAWVDVIDGTPWGFVRRIEEALEPVSMYTWEALASGRDWTQHVEVDAQGRFELGELAARTYRIVAFDARSLHSVLSAPIAAGCDGVELAIDTSSSRALVAGRVVDSSKAAVVGAHVTLGAVVPSGLDSSGELQKGMANSAEIVSDAQGRFEFRDVSTQADQLFIEPPAMRWFPCYESLSEEHDLEHIEITLPRVTFMQLELSDDALGPPGALTFVAAVDERHRRVSNSLGGMSIDMSFDHQRAGRVIPIPDSARFLLLYRAGRVELSIPIELEVGKVNLIRR